MEKVITMNKQVTVNNKTYVIEEFFGRVVESNRERETKVSGSGGGGATWNGYGTTAPVDISSETTVHDEFFLIDEQGNETLYQELFNFHSDDYDKSYILLIPAGSEPEEQVDVLAFAFNPDENDDSQDYELFDIESDEEWEMVEGVLDTFLNDENMR